MATLYISQRAWSQIEKAVRLYPDLETGGILLGNETKEQDWIITFASDPGPNALRMQNAIMFDDSYLHQMVRQKTRFSNRSHYVGDWHSHTVSKLAPSKIDRVTFNQKTIEKKYGSSSPIMLIVGLSRQNELNARAFIHQKGIRPVRKIELLSSKA